MRALYAAAGVVLCSFVMMVPGQAYTSAGDRIFPATILLPQIAPTDEFYLTGATQPVDGGRSSSLTANYAKTLTSDIAIDISEGYNWSSPTAQPVVGGFQNTALAVTYEMFEVPSHEFLLSSSLEREFGGTGTVHAGASAIGATTAWLFFGKGFGDAAPDLLKPFAIAGALGYQLGDTSARRDVLEGGLALEYSLAYFAASVGNRHLPDWLTNVTPMLEVWTTTPAQPSDGATTTWLFGPGIDYSSGGFELGVEALVPATRAAGEGVGFTVQLHVALDYLTPGVLGRPIF